MKKKIAVVTGSRSEYYLLKPLLKAIKSDPRFTLQLIVSAMHLSPEFGFTVTDIVNDGFDIADKVEMLLSSDTAIGVTKSMGLGTISFAEVFDRLLPDCLILLGDRFEALSCAQAALIAGIPIAHIHGGELSLGAFDDSIRHSITKMSHLHFTAAPSYRKRVIQLGEDPDIVFTVGPMVLDSIREMQFHDKEMLENELSIKLGKVNFLITFLPETLDNYRMSDRIQALFNALESFPEAKCWFTKGNADVEGRELNELINHFCEKYPERSSSFTNLGQQRYLSLMRLSNVVIGNSSSGVIEAPIVRIPTVNIGDRQSGRERFDSIIDCACDENAIRAAIETALSEVHQKKTQEMILPYSNELISQQIMSILAACDFTEVIKKRFLDWDFAYE